MKFSIKVNELPLFLLAVIKKEKYEFDYI